MVAEIMDPDTNLRKLVTVRRIDALDPIPNADAIEVATVEGWKVVVKRGEFKVGDPCVYFEIDSFLPDGNPAWQFLVDKQGREFDGKRGHRLKTIKLRGQLSQGFVVPLSALPMVDAAIGKRDEVKWQKLSEEEQQVLTSWISQNALQDPRHVDFSAIVGVVKWDPPLPAELAGQAKGLFPSFIRKTDQERCQNLPRQIFGYEDELFPFDIGNLPADALQAMEDKGLLKLVDGTVMKVIKAEAQRDAAYEVTMKMDGSSATFFHYNGEVGVCSRNLQLKTGDENKDNTFVRMLYDSLLNVVLPEFGNIAVQGELMGPAIQGNREQLKDFTFFVFDVQLLDEGRYMTPRERHMFMDKLRALGIIPHKVRHVPVYVGNGKFTEEVQLGDDIGHTLQDLGLHSVEDLLKFAEGPSLVNKVREGLVFKRMDGNFSFKAISNAYLLGEKE